MLVIDKIYGGGGGRRRVAEMVGINVGKIHEVEDFDPMFESPI